MVPNPIIAPYSTIMKCEASSPNWYEIVSIENRTAARVMAKGIRYVFESRLYLLLSREEGSQHQADKEIFNFQLISAKQIAYNIAETQDSPALRCQEKTP